mmetsp:Transcript_105734/g.331339  ORF Transcript_105734/g.331339 Transcript_105734/m.331339 type:complete len:613 (-) Transcript_105734:73-1911(-)
MGAAKSDGGDALQHISIVAVLLLASTTLLDPLWAHVLRQVILSVASSALVWAVTSLQASLRSTYKLLDSLLGNMCDGYVLLRQDGSVGYADPMSTDTLGLGAAASGDPATLENAFSCGGGVVMGLRSLRMTVRGKRLEMETYTIPCPPQVQRLLSVLVGPAPPPLAAAAQRYLCTIRIRQEYDDNDRSAAPASAAQQPVQAPSRGAPLPSPVMDQSRPPPPSLLHGNSNNIIQPEYAADSEELSDLCSVLRPQGRDPAAGPEEDTPYQLPGSAWQSIHAVGLGVGTYKKVRMIARGGQGSVWQVLSTAGEQYAQKDIFLKGRLWHVDFPKRLRNADREVRALKGLAWASSVIIPIIDCWIQNDFEMACIVMEWLPENLNQVLKQHRRDAAVVHAADAINWLASLAMGVAAIHYAGFIHRDLKTANILLDEQKQRCKIADLGVSRPLHRKSERTPGHDGEEMASQVSVRSERTKVSMATSVEPRSILSGYTARPGTNAYTSPEALQGSDYDALSDVFSLGCVLLEVLTLEMPPDLDLGVIESAVPMRARELLGPPQPGDDRPEAKLAALCQRMLVPRAAERPSAQMVATEPLLHRHVEKLVQECPRLRNLLVP